MNGLTRTPGDNGKPQELMLPAAGDSTLMTFVCLQRSQVVGASVLLPPQDHHLHTQTHCLCEWAGRMNAECLSFLDVRHTFLGSAPLFRSHPLHSWVSTVLPNTGISSCYMSVELHPLFLSKGLGGNFAD